MGCKPFLTIDFFVANIIPPSIEQLHGIMTGLNDKSICHRIENWAQYEILILIISKNWNTEYILFKIISCRVFLPFIKTLNKICLNDWTWEGNKIAGIFSFSFKIKMSSMHKTTTERFTT